MEAIMPDRPVTRVNPEARTDNSLLIGIVLAAVVAVLLLLGATMFRSSDESADVNATQPSTEAPATGETTKP
jgi:flagellar basal body-associated protein FliL